MPAMSTVEHTVPILVPGFEYRVLSVHPPWAWSIVFAGKDIENRSWTTPYRGPILIHASSKKYTGVLLNDARLEIARNARWPLTKVPTEFPRSALLGIVDVVDCIHDSRSRWAAPGNEHWKLANARPLAKAIEGIDGKLNLWKWTAPR